MVIKFLVFKGTSTLIQIEIEKCLNFNKDSHILNIGCGNSELADRLYDYGYHFITSNDISEAVIEQMNKVKT